MNNQVVRVFELAKAKAVIETESKYYGYDQLTPPEQVDQEALEYCIAMGWVIRGDEHFPTGRITRLSLTVEGKTTLYEREHMKPTSIREQSADTPKTSESVRAVESLLGDESKEILAIARSQSSAEDRATAICEIDKRYLAWDSPRWSSLLGVSDAAIRKGKFWKVYRPNRIAKERRDE